MDVPGGTTRDMVKGAASETTHIILDVAIQGASSAASPDLISLALNLSGLAWKAGAYYYHKNALNTQLSKCLTAYVKAGYLEEIRSSTDIKDLKSVVWKTTPLFQKTNHLLQVYNDIQQYVSDHGISNTELNALGCGAEIVIRAAPSVKMPKLIQRLSTCCINAGVRDITKTDAEKRFNVISFVHIGLIQLQNAFIAAEKGDEEGKVPPVLGRILSLLAICGIREVTIAEMPEILGKAPMFETVARTRIAKLRHQHPSDVINSVLWKGSTESAAKDFATQAASFKGDKVVVGYVEKSKKAKFGETYTGAGCEFTGSIDKSIPVGTPVYMLAGWARLVHQREQTKQENSMMKQLIHVHAPSTTTDVHGNKYMHKGKLGKITFTAKALPDGTLMAKPRKFDEFDYLCSADYAKGGNRTKATGQEKLYGGLVGPSCCGCTDADITKSELTKKWKLGEDLKVSSRDFVGNTIEHVKGLSTKKIAILWRPGDWPLGVFLMQTLPQSTYLQGRGECLHCAVESAAIAGCAEVIACGGGKVAAEAIAEHRQKTLSTPQPAKAKIEAPVTPPALSPVPSSPTSPLTPLPAYSSPTPSTRQNMEEYFAISDAQGDKIINVPRERPLSFGLIKRKPVGSSTFDMKTPATISKQDKSVAEDEVQEIMDALTLGNSGRDSVSRRVSGSGGQAIRRKPVGSAMAA